MQKTISSRPPIANLDACLSGSRFDRGKKLSLIPIAKELEKGVENAPPNGGAAKGDCC
jgi:hypothetical protein